MILIYRLIAILLRVILHFSPIGKELSKIFTFDSLAYSINNLKENSFMHNIQNSRNANSNNSSLLNSENYFSVRNILLT